MRVVWAVVGESVSTSLLHKDDSKLKKYDVTAQTDTKKPAN